VALVKAMRGTATMTSAGQSTPLAAEAWLPAGAVVRTAERSFVRLVFLDKSQMNIGPATEMRIERFGGGDAGVIDLVKGQIRSKVSKDYLQQQDKDRSKLFIKTPNAVMGVRGTDFMVSTNGTTTATVLFEGEVVFNRLTLGDTLSPRALEAVVEGPGTVRMQPGEFSVLSPGATQPTVPAVLNVQQLEKMESNGDFAAQATAAPAPTSDRSVVPPGLSGTVASNLPSALQAEVAQLTGNGVIAAVEPISPTGAASGYSQGELVKPANGSYLHIASGTVIAPPKDAVFDANSNSFLPPATTGKIAADGSYQPPRNVTITDAGNVLVQTGTRTFEVRLPGTVMGKTITLGDVMTAASAAAASPDGAATLANAVQAPRPAPFPGTTPPGAPLKEAPTLCSTCGGAIPGNAASVIEQTTVVFRPR
jgi:hypothetical protein